MRGLPTIARGELSMNDDHADRPLSPAEQLLDEAENLIWSLLDDHLDEAEAARLAELMESEPAVRARYVECVQLHVDLSLHYGKQAAEANPAPTTTVLTQLFPEGLPGIGNLPVAE
jgi:hypothetical protein